MNAIAEELRAKAQTGLGCIEVEPDLLLRAAAEIERLVAVAGAVSDGEDFVSLRVRLNTKANTDA